MLGFNTFAEAPFSTVRPIYFIGITGQQLNVAGNPAPAEPFTAFGDAQLSTAQKKFGTASLLLDGNGDYVQSDNSDFDFSSNSKNFTFEAWIRPATPGTGINGILQLGPDSYSERLYIQSNTIYAAVGPSTIIFTHYHNFSTTEFTSIAYTKNSITRRLFINGVQVDSGASANMPNVGKVSIGYRPAADQTFDGYMDEVRLSTIDRYGNSNYTPQTSEFTADTNTIGLFHFDGANGSTTITNSASQGINIIGNANVGVNTNIITAAVGDVIIFGNATAVVTGEGFEVGTSEARSATWSNLPPAGAPSKDTWKRIVTP